MRHQSAGRRIRLASCEDEHASLSVNDRGHRRRVTRSPLLSRAPHLLAGCLVEPDDTRATGRADVDDQQARLRRAASTRCRRSPAAPCTRRAGPASTAPFPMRARSSAASLRRPSCRRAVAVDHRARARPVVVAVAILEDGAVLELPAACSRLRIEALDDLLVAEPVNEDEPSSGDRRRRVARTLGELPDERRRQRPAQLRLGRDGVVRGSQERGPVVRHRAGRQRLRLSYHSRLSLGQTGQSGLNEDGLQERAT